MQPDLFAGAPRPRKAVNVPRTSVAAYRERPRDARADQIVDWVEGHDWDQSYPPTSAELAAWVWKMDRRGPVSTDCLLTVRRGLSDALRLGLVEHAGTRTCGVSGRACVTWRIAQQ